MFVLLSWTILTVGFKFLKEINLVLKITSFLCLKINWTVEMIP